MPSSRRLFGGRKPKDPAPVVDFSRLLGWLVEEVPRWAGARVEPELVRARLADRYRDARVAPVEPEAFDVLAAGLDDEAWRRLTLAVAALDFDGLREGPAPLLRAPSLDQVRVGFVGLAQSTGLLTLELLRQSPLRVEEFARRWLAGLGASIAGETVEQSRERLERLDYGRLLAEAEQAQDAVEARMEQLRKLQAERAARGARRGKF